MLYSSRQQKSNFRYFCWRTFKWAAKEKVYIFAGGPLNSAASEDPFLLAVHSSTPLPRGVPLLSHCHTALCSSPTSPGSPISTPTFAKSRLDPRDHNPLKTVTLHHLSTLCRSTLAPRASRTLSRRASVSRPTTRIRSPWCATNRPVHPNSPPPHQSRRHGTRDGRCRSLATACRRACPPNSNADC